MRLTEAEISAIKAAVAKVFGPRATVRLFGSRIDDSKRGGDIDLHVIVPPGGEQYEREIDLARELVYGLGERRVDIVITEEGAAPRDAIERAAMRDGVAL